MPSRLVGLDRRAGAVRELLGDARAGRPAGSVKSTAIGSSWVITTMPLGVGGVHEVARVDQAHAGDAVDRRRDARVVELEPRVLDLRLVGAAPSPSALADQRALVVDLLLRRSSFSSRERRRSARG